MNHKKLTTDIAEELLEQAMMTAEEKQDQSSILKSDRDYAKEFADMKKVYKVPFPIDAFPKVCAETIKSWSRCSNLPHEYFALTMLSAASTLMGNKFKIKINSRWYESPMIYGAIIGPNGIGKSAVWSYALQPINELQKKFAKELHNDLQDYKAELGERAVSKRSTADLEEPTEKLIIIDKTSMEFMMEAMWNNPHGILLFRDELKGWMMSMNQYRAGDDLQAFLEIWNNVNKSKRIKTSAYNIDRTFCNILGGIQPSLVRQLATGENVANGLFQRFLYSYPYEFLRGNYSEDEPDPAVQNRYLDIMEYLFSLPSNIYEPATRYDLPNFDYIPLEMTSEAKKEWIKYHNEISNEYNKQEDENVAGVLSKQDRYCARLALILRFLRLAETNYKYDKDVVKPPHIDWIDNTESYSDIKVEKEDVVAAIEMSKYFWNQSLRILDKLDNPANSLKDKYKLIYKELPDQFKMADALRIVEEMEEKIEGFKIGKRSLERLVNGGYGDLFHRSHQGFYSKKWEI